MTPSSAIRSSPLPSLFSSSPLLLSILLLFLLCPAPSLSTFASHHGVSNATHSVPPHYTHRHFNRTHYWHPAPNRTHPHPVPSYWMPDASFVNVDASSTAPPLVRIENRQLLVDGRPFYIQGVCYSPIPVGESPSFDPRGDYFTLEYAWIWLRDLPLIKAMGATTIRIYGWKSGADHTAFLDAVHAAGLKVLVTYYLGDAEESPVRSVQDRNRIIQQFVAQVYRYRDHPGILMWSFGNELNGSWNKFVTQISDAFGCWWTGFCAGYTDTNSDCHWQSQCMYYQLFSFINAAAKAAKVVTTRPIISGFADVDYMVGPTPWLDKVARFDWLLPDVDAWAMQLYRGYTFGGYFWMYRGESPKPMIVTEFGVDAYNDPCGWPENNGGGCFNMVGEGQGGDVAPYGRGFWGCAGGGDCARPGVEVQREWDMRLAKELMDNYPDKGGVVWGGFLMAWTDEFWKVRCPSPLPTWPCSLRRPTSSSPWPFRLSFVCRACALCVERDWLRSNRSHVVRVRPLSAMVPSSHSVVTVVCCASLQGRWYAGSVRVSMQVVGRWILPRPRRCRVQARRRCPLLLQGALHLPELGQPLPRPVRVLAGCCAGQLRERGVVRHHDAVTVLAVGQVRRPAPRHAVRAAGLHRHAAAVVRPAGGGYQRHHVRRAVAVLAVHAGPQRRGAGRRRLHQALHAALAGRGAGQLHRAQPRGGKPSTRAGVELLVALRLASAHRRARARHGRRRQRLPAVEQVAVGPSGGGGDEDAAHRPRAEGEGAQGEGGEGQRSAFAAAGCG